MNAYHLASEYLIRFVMQVELYDEEVKRITVAFGLFSNSIEDGTCVMVNPQVEVSSGGRVTGKSLSENKMSIIHQSVCRYLSGFVDEHFIREVSDVSGFEFGHHLVEQLEEAGGRVSSRLYSDIVFSLSKYEIIV